MAEGASLTLPKDLIEATINQHVQAAVAAALADKEQILSMAVGKILSDRVEEDGSPEKYGRGRPFIEWAVQKSIRQSVQKVLQEELEKHEDAMRAEIARQLRLKDSPLLRQLVDSMTSGIIDVAKDRWRMTVEYKGRD